VDRSPTFFEAYLTDKLLITCKVAKLEITHAAFGGSGNASVRRALWTSRRSRAALLRGLLRVGQALRLCAIVEGSDYKIDKVWRHYRLSALWQITWPVREAAYDIPPVIWLNNLERVMLAVDDRACRDLLGS
jgi:hypothetical protein